MDRGELIKLHAALGALLALPDSVRELIAQWLAAPRPNGHDLHPPPITSTSPRPASPPPPAKAERRALPTAADARAAERKVLAAMTAHQGATVATLAQAVGAGRSSTGERLRGLAARGAIEKDGDGHWRLAGEEARSAGGGSRPTIPPSP
jgi:hypothetical protein